MGHYFIRVEDAKNLRRKVLESSKASLNVLKGYQTLLKVRGEKMTLMKNLRANLKELSILVNKVDEIMPHLTKQEIAQFSDKSLGTETRKSPKSSKKRGGRRKRTPALPALKDEKKVFIGVPGEKKQHTPKKAVVPKEPEPQSPRRLSELDALQKKMQDIESKLGTL